MNRKSANRVQRCSFETLESRQLLTSITVTTLNDSGTGSLRAAIGSASSGDTIVFGNLAGTIDLQSPLVLDGKSLTITGSGRDKLTLDGSATTHVITSTGDNGITLSDMKIIGGDATPDTTSAGNQGGAVAIFGNSSSDLGSLTLSSVDETGGKSFSDGGGIYAYNANVTVNDSSFSNNLASGTNGYGGAIFDDFGTLTATASSFYDNAAVGQSDTKDAGGGAISSNNGTLFMTNCTVANNTVKKIAASSTPVTVASFGGGVSVLEGSGQITNCTIVDNTVIAASNSTGTNVGGGLYFDQNNTIYVQTSIVADNTAPASADMYSVTPSSVLAGYDLIGDGTGSGATNGQYGSQVGTTANPINPLIGQLGNNGGDTQTVPLLTGSPAIDNGYNIGPSTDQRGAPRGSTPDIGAYEYVTPVQPTFASTPTVTVSSDGKSADCTASATVTDFTALSYQWTVLSKPANAQTPALSTPASSTTGATFNRAGTYVFQVTATSSAGLSHSYPVSVVVSQLPTQLRIIQHQQTLSSTAKTAMRAIVSDQFGTILASQPAIQWILVEGDGSIKRTTGVFTPVSVKYSHLLFRASAGNLSGIAGNRLKRHS